MTTSNTNPDWMRDLKLNFAAEIVEPCSQWTRKAVENNEDIEVRIGEEMFANNSGEIKVKNTILLICSSRHQYVEES